MKKEVLLKIIRNTKEAIGNLYRERKWFEGLCFALQEETTRNKEKYPNVKKMFIEFYNQKFGDTRTSDDKLFFTYDKKQPFGIFSIRDWLCVSGGTRIHTQEYLDKWWECREKFLGDWETDIINGNFKSEYLEK
jgi:hypothetical protein